MAIVTRSLVLLAGLVWALSVPLVAVAEEPVFEFLHAAQDNGYGEAAISYLEQLRASGRLPKELNETYDLELSRSYRVAMSEAFNANEAAERLAQAQKCLDKFLKEHPNHAAIGRALDSWGDIALDRALERIHAAGTTKDAAQQEKLFTAARADLEEARPRFVDATARYLDRYTKLKAAAKAEAAKRRKSTQPLTKKQRQAQDELRDSEAAWLECRIKSAKIDFYLGKTWLDEKAPQRKTALENTAKAFDAIFQSYRENLVGLHAHMWHGRAADELGDNPLALDIYDEVLASAPEGGAATGLEPLFAQVQYQRLLVVKRASGAKEMLAQAEAWLESHKNWSKFDGFQGVVLEEAKANLQIADELTGAKKVDLTRTALAELNKIAKTRGEHQQEAILLRRELTKSDPKSDAQELTGVKTFDEAVAIGESAVENSDWSAAAAAFAKAMELSGPVKDAKRVAAVQNRLDQARYQAAAALFAADKFAESLAAAEELAGQRPDGSLAPRASSLAVAAALSLYSSATDKPAALARLEKLAQDLIARWPDKPEADDARIAMGQAALVRGELTGAVTVFERVNPRSLRYPAAMHLAGQTNWRLYLAAKAKGTTDPQQLTELRDKATEQLQTSLAAQRKEAAGTKTLTRTMVETQLLLAEATAEAGQAQEAAALLEPLVEWIRAEKPNPPDNTVLRAFLAATRAQLALGQIDKATATANLLFELAPDEAGPNGVLGSVLKMFGDAWKQAEAAAIEARTAGDAPARAAAEAAAGDRKQQLSQLLARLAPRKANGLPALIYIADTSAQLGQPDTARELYQAVLAQAENDAVFKQANAAALTRIQSQLVGLLRQKGQFAEGLAEVDKLIAKFPNALEPKMEKGRLLQAWSDQDPAHFDEAVAHWTMLRTRLAKATKKPPEYYEVVYNAASCLFTESMKTRNQQKALQAEQLLNATLVLSPKLNGPEMVAKYKELLQKARQLQGRSATASAKN